MEEAEFDLNNTLSCATKNTPSRLLFGIDQNGGVEDGLRDIVAQPTQLHELVEIRQKARVEQEKSQTMNRRLFDKKHKEPKVYEAGDRVMVDNVVVQPGINRKLLSKFKGPYRIKEVFIP